MLQTPTKDDHCRSMNSYAGVSVTVSGLHRARLSSCSSRRRLSDPDKIEQERAGGNRRTVLGT